MLGLLPAGARTLSPAEAQSAVRQFFRGSAMRAPAAVGAGLHLSATVRTPAGEPALYIFAGPGADGMVVASAESGTPAVLGYADAGAFDYATANPQLRYWLDTYAREIEALRQAPQPKSPMLSRAPRAARAAIQPICKTLWDQRAPFNDMCPALTGTRTVTGCVATAVSQAMKVFQWPEQGSGTVSYQWEAGRRTLTADLSGSTYAWSDMVDNYSEGSPTSAQDQAVATLMRDVGYAVNMNYNTATAGGSGASEMMIAPALIENFGYDKAMYLAPRDCYELDTWEDMVYGELALGRPVIYVGQGTAGGHCFICDGYRADGYFHMNWGWNGDSDGYYLLSALNPPALGTGGGAGGFNSMQSAMMGMQKPVAGSAYHYTMRNYDALTISPTTASLDATYTLSGQFVNTSATAFTGAIGVKVTDEAGNATYINCGQFDTPVKPLYGLTQYNVDGSDLPATPGTYTVAPVFKPDGAEWQEMLSDVTEVGSYTMTVSASQRVFAPVGGSSQSDADIYVDAVSLSSTSLTLGSSVTATGTLYNQGDSDFSGSIYGVLVYEQDGKYYAEDSSSAMNVSVPAGSNQGIIYPCTFSRADPGTYDFYFAYDNHLISQGVSVTISGTPSQGTAELYAYNVTLDSDALQNGKPYTATATLYNEGDGDFSGSIQGALLYESGGSYYAAGRSAEMNVQVEAGQMKEITYTGTFTDVEPGTYEFCFISGNSAISTSVDVTISGAVEDTELSVSALRFLSGQKGSDGVQELMSDDIAVGATVQCTSGAFTSEVKADIFSADGSYLATLGSETLSLAKGESRAIEVRGTFPQGQTGSTYRIALFTGEEQIGSQHLTFRIAGQSGINGVGAGKASLRLHADLLEVRDARRMGTLTVYDAAGKPVLSTTERQLNVGSLAPGMYVAVATTDAGALRLPLLR